MSAGGHCRALVHVGVAHEQRPVGSHPEASHGRSQAAGVRLFGPHVDRGHDDLQQIRQPTGSERLAHLLAGHDGGVGESPQPVALPEPPKVTDHLADRFGTQRRDGCAGCFGVHERVPDVEDDRRHVGQPLGRRTVAARTWVRLGRRDDPILGLCGPSAAVAESGSAVDACLGSPVGERQAGRIHAHRLGQQPGRRRRVGIAPQLAEMSGRKRRHIGGERVQILREIQDRVRIQAERSSYSRPISAVAPGGRNSRVTTHHGADGTGWPPGSAGGVIHSGPHRPQRRRVLRLAGRRPPASMLCTPRRRVLIAPGQVERVSGAKKVRYHALVTSRAASSTSTSVSLSAWWANHA